MKRSESLEQNRIQPPRASGIGRITAAASAKAIQLSPARRSEPADLLEEPFPDSDAHTVRFEYFNPVAHEVLVAGSFNDWQAQATPMKKQRGGKWTAKVVLKPGPYEYLFVVDGQWRDDPMAARHAANPFGGLNCVVEVKAIAPNEGSWP